MIERGSGRTSGLTDWQLMDVNSMWACLQDHDTANHWKQVAGWRKVCDLAQIHLGRLQEYRRGLAEAWPPETSAASGTYLAELDELIAKVQHTHDAAAANYTALSAATQAIGTTRAELRKVYEEYAGKLQQRQAYEATAADPKAVMGSRVTESPVTDAELERLNVQARGMMFNLSGELQQAQATLQNHRPGRRPTPASIRVTQTRMTQLPLRSFLRSSQCRSQTSQQSSHPRNGFGAGANRTRRRSGAGRSTRHNHPRPNKFTSTNQCHTANAAQPNTRLRGTAAAAYHLCTW
ncbi:hypothetical protein GCM10027614_38670 [Micromonospora vulcania]